MLTFKDRQFNTVAQVHYNGGDLCFVDTDIFTKDVQSGVSTYEFTLAKNDETIGDITVGNYVIAKDGDDVKTFEIINISETSEEKTFYCEDGGLDLVGEVVEPYSAKKSMTLQEYCDVFLYDSGFVVGVDETEGRTLTLEWEGYATAVKRLKELASRFDTELDYKIELDPTGAILKRTVNFYKRLGQNKNIILRTGKEIKTVNKEVDISNLATTVIGYGKEDMTLEGYSFKEGSIRLSGKYLIDDEAVAKWKRFGDTEAGGGIVKRYFSEASTQKTLCDETVRKLKEWNKPHITYNVEVIEVPEHLSVGDNVTIIDTEDFPPLVVEGRVSLIEKKALF